MRHATIAVSLVLAVAGGAGSAGAQCGEPAGEWAYGPTECTAGNGATAVFGAGRMLQVADIGDPTNPAVVGAMALGDRIRGMAIAGAYAFVAASEAGLIVIDISDPNNPAQVATWPTSDMVINVTLNGQRAYVANRSGGMVILDISDPTDPVQLGAINPGGMVWAIAIQGEIAFVANSHDGFQVINITDETDPQLLTTLAEAGYCRGIDLSDDGNYAFVADYFEGLRVVDISDPTSPALAAFVDVHSYATDIRVQGTYAYLGNRGNGLRIYDISDPTSPVEVRQIETDGSTVRVTIHEDLVYLANYDGGLRVVDVAVPTEAEELGFIEGVPCLSGPAIEGSLAVLSGGSKLVMLDISEPSAPVEIATTEFSGYAEKAMIDGNLAYVADGVGGVDVLDLSDPGNPLLLASADTPAAYDLALDGDILFVACHSDGLRVVDVSDPTAPVVIGILEGISTESLAHAGGMLYVQDHNVGVHIIDVTDPSAPTEVGLLADTNPMSRPAIQGNTMYVADSGHGVRIFDITDPRAPTEIALIFQSRFPYGLAAIGQILFIADIYDDAFIFDVSDPHEPVELAAPPLATTAQGDITSEGSLVLVTEREGGVELFDLGACFSEPPTADFTWRPANPEAGRPVQLTDTSIGSIVDRQWHFDDGATSSKRNPTHVWTEAGDYAVRLTVNGPLGSQSATQTVTVQPWSGDVPPITDPGAFAYVIAAAAHAPGLEGTQWVTDAVLHNPGVESAEAFLWFMKAEQDNTGAAGIGVSVAPGASELIEDVVLSMFEENEAAGAILIGANHRLLVTSRTYNDASSGTFGQFIPGRDVRNGIVQDQSVHLIQLTRTPNYRTNLGVANPTGASLRIDVSLRDANGTEINSRTLTAPPFGFIQRTDILGLNAKDAFAVVSSSTVGASFFPYASVVDNRTGDPMMVEPIYPNDHLLVSAAAHVGGLENTDWRTNLEIYNPQATPVELQLNLLMSGEDNSSPPSVTMTLGQGACVRLADVLDNQFSHEGTAALEVHSLSGDLVVASRTFNSTDDGTYGQFLPGIGPAETTTSGEEARIIQLAQDTTDDTGFRTNIGFVNRAPTTTSVKTDLYSSDGTHLSALTTQLDPFEHRQVNRIFRQVTSAPVTNGYAIVTTQSAEGSFVAYASVIDNASGDPIFIPATRVATEPVLFKLLATGGASGASGFYGSNDDLDLGCTSWFGLTAFVADWSDVVTLWEADGEAFAEDAWIRSGRSYLVEQDGEAFRPGTDEHYLIARHDGDLPSDFVSLDDVGDHFIDLGSEEDTTLQVICRRPLE